MEVRRWAAMIPDTSSGSSDEDLPSSDDESTTSRFEWSLKDYLSDVSGRSSPVIGGKSNAIFSTCVYSGII